MMHFGIVKFGIQRKQKDRLKDNKGADHLAVHTTNGNIPEHELHNPCILPNLDSTQDYSSLFDKIPENTAENMESLLQPMDIIFQKKTMISAPDVIPSHEIMDVKELPDENDEPSALDLSTSKKSLSLPPAGHVTLEALENTKVAVAQFAATALAHSSCNEDALKEFASIQSTLFNLQSQQLWQIQLIHQLKNKLSGIPLIQTNDDEEKDKIDESLQNKRNHVEPHKEEESEKTDENKIVDIGSKPKEVKNEEEVKELAQKSRPQHSPYPTSSSLASSIITNHDPPPPFDEPNSLEMLQKRTQEVLDSASRDLLGGNLADELLFRRDCDSSDGKGKNDPFFKHRCRYCGKIFGSDSALQIHIRSHTGERPFKCDVCGSCFTTKGNLKVHYQRHTQRYPCFQMMESMERFPVPPPHILSNMQFEKFGRVSNETPMDVPQVSGSRDTNLTETSEQKEATDLTLLGKRQDNRVEEKIVMRLENSLDNLQNDQPVNLSTLRHAAPSENSNASVSLEMLNSHQNSNVSIEINDNSWESLIEIAKTSETSKLQILVDNIETKLTEPNQCVFCHRTLSCRSALQMHLRTHTGERPFRCRICGRAFATKGNLKAHMIIHKIKPPIRSQFKCPVCHTKFSNSIMLTEHLRTHASEEIDQAKGLNEEIGNRRKESFDASCSETSERRSECSAGDYSECTNDMDDMDDKTNAEDCNGDEKSTSGSEHSNGVLDLSMQFGSREKTDLKRSAASFFNCLNFLRDSSPAAPINSSSSTQASMSKAVDIQASDESFKCSTCNETCPTKDTLEQHIATHKDLDRNIQISSPFELTPETDSNNPSPLQSPLALLIQQSSERNVESFHRQGQSTDIKSEQQSFPNNLFYTKLPSRTVDHADAKHKIAENSTNELPLHLQQIQQQNHQPQQQQLNCDGSVNMKHFCTICRKNFSSSSALQIHMRTHTGDKPFQCTVCQKAFTTKGNLKVHMGTHMWTNGSSRRGRRMSLELPIGRPVLMKSDAEFLHRRPDFFYPYFPPLVNGVQNKFNDMPPFAFGQNQHENGVSHKYARLLGLGSFLPGQSPPISSLTQNPFRNMLSPLFANEDQNGNARQNAGNDKASSKQYESNQGKGNAFRIEDKFWDSNSNENSEATARSSELIFPTNQSNQSEELAA